MRRLKSEENDQTTRLRDTTTTWLVGLMAAGAVSAGIFQVASGDLFELVFVAIGAFWAFVAVRSYVVVGDAEVEVHHLWRTESVALGEIVGFEVHEMGVFWGHGKSVLRIHLASDDSVDIHAGVVPLGPSKFHGQVARTIAARMEAQGYEITVPFELRYI